MKGEREAKRGEGREAEIEGNGTVKGRGMGKEELRKNGRWRGNVRGRWRVKGK